MRMPPLKGWIVLLVGLSLPSWALASSVILANQAYSFDPPVGFVEVRDDFPRLLQSARQSVPSGHQLLQFYIADTALEGYRNGERLDLNAYGSLAWIQSLGQQVNNVDYIFIRRYLKREYGPLVEANQAVIERLHGDYLDGEVDNERLRKRLNSGESLPAALIDEGETALAYVSLQRGTGTTLGEGDDQLLACGMTIKRLGRKVFSLRLCQPYEARSDIDGVAAQIAEWAGHLSTLNP